MAESQRIFLVEDEEALSSVLRDYLIDAGYEVTLFATGGPVVKAVEDLRPDLVVLDIMLPEVDGITICREIRKTSMVPIIMETARVEEIDRLLGLELGADDYLCKPFSPRELVARVKAVLRRAGASLQSVAAVPEQRITLDETAWKAEVDSQSLSLTRREFQLLAVLMSRPGRVYSRAQLLDLAYDNDPDVFDRTIDSHIKNLRKKIRDRAADFDPIRSVYGVGYSFEEENS